jgi:NAD(P)-dependent dehydrogenase (short-subunit alcohol dehydrogenase family)
VAIVTGAGSGIGRETAIAFATEGASVLVADIAEAGGIETVEMIGSSDGTARFVRTDVADDAQVDALVATAMREHGRIDVLHNNAYWAPLNRALADTSRADWDRTLAVTLTGVYLGCHAVLPHMLAAGHGAIVNTASTAALVGSPAFAAYSAAKAGVLGLTRSVAFDYGQRGIRCNAVCPGLIETPATAPVLADPERRAWLSARVLTPRIGRPRDIADAVLYLASDESAFLTGQALTVDGGRTIA